MIIVVSMKKRLFTYQEIEERFETDVICDIIEDITRCVFENKTPNDYFFNTEHASYPHVYKSIVEL